MGVNVRGVNDTPRINRCQPIPRQRTRVVVSGHDIETETDLTALFLRFFGRGIPGVANPLLLARKGQPHQRVQSNALLRLKYLAINNRRAFSCQLGSMARATNPESAESPGG